MKHKVSELLPPLLDAAVAKADGASAERVRLVMNFPLADVGPSEDWARGGPIIERERIELIPQYVQIEGRPPAAWEAVIQSRWSAFGGTPLIAAMRVYVSAKLADGADEVDLP